MYLNSISTHKENIEKVNNKKLEENENEVNKRERSRKEKHCIMIEKKLETIDDLQIEASIKDKQIKALIDTGAQRVFISEKLADKLKLQQRKDKEISLITANKENFETNRVVYTRKSLKILIKNLI